MAKNKKIVEGEEDEEEEELYDEGYDIKPVSAPVSTSATLPKSDSSLNINKEISINDHPEDLVVGANSPLEINNSTKTENPEVSLSLYSSNSNGNSIDNNEKGGDNNIKSNLPKSNSILDIKKSTEEEESISVNNTNSSNNNGDNNYNNSYSNNSNKTTTTTTTTTNLNSSLSKEEISSPIQLITPSPIPSSSSTSSQNLSDQQQPSNTHVLPQRKSSSSQPPQPVRIPLSLGEHKLREYNETLRKSFCARSHNLYFTINREVSNANQHLSSVLDIVKSIQHNIRQSNDDILILSEKLEQTEWSLQC